MKKAAYLLIAGIVLIVSCAREVQTVKVEGFDFSNYETFAFLPPGDTILNTFLDEQSANQIMNRVSSEFQKRGYKLDTKNPDFLILVHTNFGLGQEIRTMPSGYAYYGPGFYPGPFYGTYYYPDYFNYPVIGATPNIEVVEYVRGTLVIDVIDAKSKQIVWRGYTQEREYDYDYTYDLEQKEIDEVIEELTDDINNIVENFPESS
ncbi:MAG TPA: DUF4136 domain-containing protein [Cytophagaceae bacterium]